MIKNLHISIQKNELFTDIDYINKKNLTCGLNSIKTTRKDLDEMTSGFETGLTVMAARPSMGKTAFVLSIVLENSIKYQKNCIFFSLESTYLTILKRSLAYLTGIDFLKVNHARFNEADCEKINLTIPMFDNSGFYINDDATTIKCIESTLKHINFSPDLIVVDSFQMLENHNPKITRHHNLNEIILRLKDIAFKKQCPVILTSHLHKQLELRADKRPFFPLDFSETDFPYQAADKVLFLYRDEIYNSNTTDKGTIEVICAKNKSGPIGKVRLRYIPNTGVFADLTK